MKKAIVLIIFLSLLLIGCEAESSQPMIKNVSMEYSDFNLVVDSKTNIVYIDNAFDYEGGLPGHVYTPYYGKHGKLCKFVDGKVVEIE